MTASKKVSDSNSNPSSDKGSDKSSGKNSGNRDKSITSLKTASTKDLMKSIGKELSSKDAMMQYYRDMVLIRRFEERAGALYGSGEIAGFCHLYIGQEAVVVGMQAVLSETDTVITAYRDHGHMLACGMDPKGVMAELTGRRDGYSKGKGGSMHMFSAEKNFYGGHGIVGAQVPLGAGLAFAHKYREDGGLCATYFGDGSANQGQVYEAFNMASLWKLPVVFILENNGYAMGTSVARHAAGGDLSKRGEAFGIPGHKVDGMNILEVIKAGKMAVDHVRSGKGPILLEMNTYRYRGHSMSDPAKYRTKEEVDDFKVNRDPITQIKDTLESQFDVNADDLKALDKETRDICKQAAEFSLESPEPDPSELYTDILIETTSDKTSAAESNTTGSNSNSNHSSTTNSKSFDW